MRTRKVWREDGERSGRHVAVFLVELSSDEAHVIARVLDGSGSLVGRQAARDIGAADMSSGDWIESEIGTRPFPRARRS